MTDEQITKEPVPTLPDKIRSFIETLEEEEQKQLIALIETAEESYKKKIIVTQEASEAPAVHEQPVVEPHTEVKKKKRSFRKSYIVEPLPGNKTRIIEDEHEA